VKTAELTTLSQLPFHLAEHCQKPALLRRCRADGYDDLSTQEFYERVRDLSLGLAGLGLEPGDRLALVSESRPEWCIADLATLTAAAVTVPVYPTQSAGQMGYILNDCGAKVAIVSNDHQAQKLLQVRDDVGTLLAIVVIDGETRPAGDGLPVFSIADILARGRANATIDPGAETRYRGKAMSRGPDDLATIVYTSGTTGEPKGVMLTHANILSNARATEAIIPMTSADVVLSFLPLSHVFERLTVFRCLYNGVTVAFAESLSTVPRDLRRVRPTVMTGVPRFYEKFLAAILDSVAKMPAFRQNLFRWATDLGKACVREELAGRAVPIAKKIQRAIADRLVYARIRARAGGRLRYLVSGSAPLSRVLAEFFLSIGLPIIEGYGLTETSPVVAAMPPDAIRLGTVGRAVPGVEIRIAADGEIITRGPNVMTGYYGKPDMTAEVIKDGWFYTGDIGQLDGDGYLAITDRKKDLIVTSGGKKIAPQPLEGALKENRLVAEAVVVGEGRKFPAVLIVPDFALLEQRARAMGLGPSSREDLVTNEEVLKLYQALVDQLNVSLGQFERIKKIAILPSEFTMERDELTPTMKVRRKVVEDRWRDVIDRLYEERRAPGLTGQSPEPRDQEGMLGAPSRALSPESL
jgi:long-chain acyl-CoA synthetase